MSIDWGHFFEIASPETLKTLNKYIPETIEEAANKQGYTCKNNQLQPLKNSDKEAKGGKTK